MDPARLGRAASLAGLLFQSLFLGLFVVVGIGFLVAFGLVPTWRWASARSWPGTTCEVLESRMLAEQPPAERAEEPPGEDGGAQGRALIRFRYAWPGHRGESSRIWRDGEPDGERARSLVASHPVGWRGPCWVPRGDTEAVLLRPDFPHQVWFLLVWGALFAGIPATILVVQWRGFRQRRRTEAAMAPPGPAPVRPAASRWRPVLQTGGLSTPVQPIEEGGERILRSGTASRWGAPIVLLVFALFWNGMVWGLAMREALQSLGRGDGIGSAFSAFFLLFLVPFVLIGLGLLGFGGYLLLRAVATPRIELLLPPGPLRAGGTLRLGWRLVGGRATVRRLGLNLLAREESSYRRGTSTLTDRHELSRLALTDLELPDRTGSIDCPLPADWPPPWRSDSNQVVWALTVAGEVPRLPDLDEDFALAVEAAEPAAEPADQEGTIRLAAGVRRRGGRLAGSLHWSLERRPDRLSLRLLWRVSGKGDPESGLSDRLELETPPAQGEAAFDLRLEGPPSYQGVLISVLWTLELVDDAGQVVATRAVEVV